MYFTNLGGAIRQFSRPFLKGNQIMSDTALFLVQADIDGI